MDKLKIIKKYWGKKTPDEIGKLTGQTGNAVHHMARAHGLPRITVDGKIISAKESIVRDSKLDNLDSKAKQADKKYHVVKEENEILKALLEATKAVGKSNTYTIRTKKSDGGGVTAVAVASDWHYEETVASENVNGKNEYNLTIARKRADLFFINLVRLVKIFSKESQLDTLILALLGDFINGQLREEAMENNSLRPMDAMIQVKDILSSGIRYVLENTTVKLILPCHSGNHGRVTKKVHISTESGNSLEYVMYHVLASEFKDNKRIHFIIPTSYHSFIPINDYVIRFHHGHAMNYNGGVGGITISVNKAIAQWNKAKRADLDVFGHFHQMRDGGNFICNGSLIGWNEFANFIKADFEVPKQVFFLVDNKRGAKSVTAPIFLN